MNRILWLVTAASGLMIAKPGLCDDKTTVSPSPTPAATSCPELTSSATSGARPRFRGLFDFLKTKASEHRENKKDCPAKVCAKEGPVAFQRYEAPAACSSSNAACPQCKQGCAAKVCAKEAPIALQHYEAPAACLSCNAGGTQCNQGCAANAPIRQMPVGILQHESPAACSNCNAGGPRESDFHKLYRFLTYHPLRYNDCHTFCCDCCGDPRPPLYAYFVRPCADKGPQAPITCLDGVKPPHFAKARSKQSTSDCSCPQCGAVLEPGQKTCSACGH